VEKKTLTIGELANRVGMRTSTLRYYEEQGLLTPQSRSPAGYRLYNPQDEQVLLFISRSNALGFFWLIFVPCWKHARLAVWMKRWSSPCQSTLPCD
jgi:hypothetical protein